MIDCTAPRDEHVPAVSVVMTAHNEGPFIDAAVASVLAQRFTDFELIIRDDGSSDGIGELLDRWARHDARIRLCRGVRSRGASGGGNFVVDRARSPLIARMDADDIAEPDWLGRLHAEIVDRPDVVLVGCLWSGIDTHGRPVRVADRWRAARPSIYPPFGHGSSMFRKAAFERIGGYRQACAYWEDFDLVLRLAGEGRILFVPDALYRYRFASSSTRQVSDPRLVERGVNLMFACAEAFRTRGEYESTLAAHAAPDAAPSEPTLRTILSLSSYRLWNGRRPGRLRQIARAMATPATRADPLVLAMALWGELGPRSLRWTLATFIRLRAKFSSLRPDGQAVAWDPRRAMLPAARHVVAASPAFDFVAASCRARDAPGRDAAIAAAAARPIDPRALLQLTRWHRVAPFVQLAVDESGLALPAKEAAALARMARKARLQAIANAAEEARLANAAERTGLDLLFVKGATLAYLVHRDPSAKTAWDIDVLIDPRDLAPACDLLERQGYALILPEGVVAGPRRDRWLAGTRESLWRNAARGTAVELHTGLSDSGGLIAGIGMGSPRQTVEIAGAAVPTLADAELFAFLVAHGTIHRWARLKWLADVAAMIAASPARVERWHAAAQAHGAGRCGGVALLLCAELFGLDLPTQLRRRLAADATIARLVDACHAAMDQVGDPDKRLAATTLREMARAMLLQYRLAPGVGYRLRTFWSHWTRPYAASQLAIPARLLPLAMLVWLPLRLLGRGWRSLRGGAGH